MLDTGRGGASPELRDRVRIALPCERRQADNVLFLHEATPCIDLPHAGGWIVGNLFGRSMIDSINRFTAAQDLAVASTGGNILLRGFWGRYAAIWRGTGGPHALRDPSGMLPVYCARANGLALVTSDVELLIATGLIEPSVAWEMVRHGLLYPQLPTARTHLTGVRELLPGTRVALTETKASPTLLWKPWTFANPDPTLGASAADQARLANIVDESVAAWSSGHDHIQLELSGGLDSSILAASLARTGRPFSCVNMASPGSDGDERDYARAVARHVGVALAEFSTSPDLADPFAALPRWTPRPRGMRIMAALDQIFERAARDANADAIFSGGGGDNVFCYTNSTAPVLDAWDAHGLPAARMAAVDVARVTRTTVGQVYAHALKRWCVDRTRRSWPADRSFLAAGVRCKVDRHPWLDLPPESPSGTRAHIGAIVRIHDILDAHQRMAEQTMIFPLLSQPVVEACLAIPSWHWVAGGRDRAVARDAFAARLPEMIVRRSGKGVLNSLLLPAFERSQSRMRDLLCEGTLARAGLLDRAVIAAALGRPITENPDIYGRILELVDAELWVESVIAGSQCGHA